MTKPYKNIFLISFSYLITSIFNIIFLYYLLFYNSDQTSGNPLAWTLVRVSFLIPSAIISIFIGMLADKFDKQKMMYSAEFINFLAIGIFAILSNLGFNKTIDFFIIGLLSNSIFAFYEISLDASMLDIFGEKISEKMISSIWLMRALSFIFGPILAEKFYIYSNLNFICYINSFSFLISGLCLYFVKFNYKNVSSNKVNFKEDFLSLRSYITKTPIIIFFIFLDVAIALFYIPIYDAIVPAIDSALHLNRLGTAYIEAASWSGTALASLFIMLFGRINFFLKNLFVIISIEMFLLTLWLFPLFFNISPSKTLYILIFLALIDGALNAAQTLGALNYFQIKVPSELRGKISGLIKTIMRISSPFAIIMYGLMLKKISWSKAHIFSIIMIAFISLFLANSKVFKNFSNKLG